MEKLSLSSTPSSFLSHSHPLSISAPPRTRIIRKVSFLHFSNPRKFSVSASKEDDDDDAKKFDQWDLMELKFGRMLGEDPKLTLAKVMGRKANPDASYVEIEKNYYKNKGKLVEMKEVPFEVPQKRGSSKASNGLNLAKPVPNKGTNVGVSQIKSKLPEIKRPNESARNKLGSVTMYSGESHFDSPEMKKPNESIRNDTGTASKSNVPNVILRKPSVFKEEDEADNSSRLRIKPNLSFSMRTEPVLDKFGEMTLLKKPEQVDTSEDNGGETKKSSMNGLVNRESTNGALDDFEGDMVNEGQSSMSNSGAFKLSEKPKATTHHNAGSNVSTFRADGMTAILGDDIEDSSESKVQGMKQDEQIADGYSGKEFGAGKSATSGASSSTVDSVFLGRPSRLDQSVKDMSHANQEEIVSAYPESLNTQGEKDKLPLTRPRQGVEETDWIRLEQRLKSGDRVDVELISCSPRGFVVSYGSLIGFLPYRNLAAKWKFLAFESWLRKNGLDPSKYRQNLGIIGDDGASNNSSLETSLLQDLSPKAGFAVTPDMELEDLLRIYDQEKIQYLSSYIGEHIKVNILLADRKSRKLIFSMRPKEKEEIVERKRSLMAKLSIGDVVKCCIKKITYFGVFVEVEGVPALIHQTEVSWDATLDPSSYLKIGQIVDAKVHQLDFASERIFLSLKEISPDPLNEALECIVGNSSFNGGLQAAQTDLEWAEVDSLIKELEEVDGVQNVTKGRFFLSPGLAPTFQVYMASMFENQYKLLARSGNKVQEVMVQTLLDKEEMKSAILNCTNRVAL